MIRAVPKRRPTHLEAEDKPSRSLTERLLSGRKSVTGRG
jgi:hypothetical protein